MRKKSQERQDAIVAAAAEVFKENGFEQTSMDEIAARMACSKATIYNYFPSKDDLFIEVLLFSARDVAKDVFQAVRDIQDLRAALTEFGGRFIRFATSPDVMAIKRMVIASAANRSTAKDFYAKGPAMGIAALAQALAERVALGELRDADTTIMAMHLKGLLESEWHTKCLLGAHAAPNPAAVRESVERAVDVFLRAYGL